jgi:pantetheine-phosphate adenylyltransferase
MKKTALFPGTFDPPSQGHLDIIQRASKICDKLYIGVAKNQNKSQTIFTAEEKVELLCILTKTLPGVHVVSFEGLVVDFSKAHQVDFLIRGLRAFSDVEYEFRMALANKKMGGIETIFLMANPQLTHISATLIREIALHGRRLDDFVPAEIESIVFEKLQKRILK